MLLDSIAVIMSGASLGGSSSFGVSGLIKALSMRTRYEYFTLGILGIDNIVYFASISFFFFFFSANRFENRQCT
jgi:hypothetical protein